MSLVGKEGEGSVVPDCNHLWLEGDWGSDGGSLVLSGLVVVDWVFGKRGCVYGCWIVRNNWILGEDGCLGGWDCWQDMVKCGGVDVLWWGWLWVLNGVA